MAIRREPAFILFGKDVSYQAWRPVGLFFAAYFAAYLVGAVLAPVSYWIVQALPESQSIDLSLIGYLKEQSFTRYVDRVRMVATAGLLLWLIRYCGIWGRFGFFWRRQGLRPVPVFMSLGILSMGLVIAGQLLFCGYELRNGISILYLFNVAVVAIAGALILGWLEEAVFRGLLFRMFYTAMSPLPAILMSALVFAAMHFKKVPWLNGMEVHWFSGFKVAALQSVSFLFTVEWLVFCNYVLVGIVLNLLFLRTKSLIGCMGLHAGWVLTRNFWRKLVDVPSEQTNHFWGTERIVDGFACLLILSILVVVLYVNWWKNQRKQQTVLGAIP